VIRISGEPVRPCLQMQCSRKLSPRDHQHVRRLGELHLQSAMSRSLCHRPGCTDRPRRRCGVAGADSSQQDREREGVGVGLLPERLLLFPEQVVQERGHGVGHRIGIELVVERVVASAGAETDLEVVSLTARPAAASSEPGRRSQL
jgi:hypothetical protein